VEEPAEGQMAEEQIMDRVADKISRAAEARRSHPPGHSAEDPAAEVLAGEFPAADSLCTGQAPAASLSFGLKFRTENPKSGQFL